MKTAHLGAATGAFLIVVGVAACGASASSGKGSGGSQPSVAQGQYTCHDILFAPDDHPARSFPALSLRDGRYTVAGHAGGTYLANADGMTTSLAFKGGLLGGSTARYDAQVREVTFGGPTDTNGRIEEASGVVCDIA